MSTTAGTGLEDYEEEFAGKHHLPGVSAAPATTTPATDPAGDADPNGGIPSSHVEGDKQAGDSGPMKPRGGIPSSHVVEFDDEEAIESGPMKPRGGIPSSHVVGEPTA